MRVSTSNMFDANIATLQRRQQNLLESQQRLTSGKKVERASDDPTSAARAERALTTIGRMDANQRALEASRNSLTLSESALGDSSELLQQVRESMVAAGNASYTDAERAGLAKKITGLRDQLLSIANRSDGAGGYLFAGQGTDSAPFVDNPAPLGVTYVGIPGARSSGTQDVYPLTVDGRAAWEMARTGNGSFVTSAQGNPSGATPKSWIDSGRVLDPSAVTGANYQIVVNGTGATATYSVTNLSTGAAVTTDDPTGAFKTGKAIKFDGITVTLSGSAQDGDTFNINPSAPGLKVFDVLDKAIADLTTTNRSPIEIAQTNSSSLRDLDAVMGQLQNVRSQVGEQLNNLDGSESRMASVKLYSQSEKSAAEDLDMVQGISDFQNQQTSYDAALKTYASVQKLSLFQYINA